MPKAITFQLISDWFTMRHWKCCIIMISLAIVWCNPLDREWKSWKEKHGKTYTKESEEAYRRKIWLENTHYINEHNKQNHTFKLIINGFADMVSYHSVLGLESLCSDDLDTGGVWTHLSQTDGSRSKLVGSKTDTHQKIQCHIP